VADPYPHTDEGLWQALVDLGRTNSAVALTLMRGGWRGKRNHCAKCPVANYLAAKFGRDCILDVGPDSVSLTREMWIDQGYGMGYSEPQTIGARLPLPVRTWMREFDFSLRYGFLEAA
jgi:hypothetical protein